MRYTTLLLPKSIASDCDAFGPPPQSAWPIVVILRRRGETLNDDFDSGVKGGKPLWGGYQSRARQQAPKRHTKAFVIDPDLGKEHGSGVR